jgi:glutamine synthetase
MYAEGHTVKDAKSSPQPARCAARARQVERLESGFGEDVVASYIKLRQAEWNEYAGQLTDWERQTTLDC